MEDRGSAPYSLEPFSPTPYPLGSYHCGLMGREQEDGGQGRTKLKLIGKSSE